MSKTETLSVDLLVLDGDTQARIDVNSETVEEYAELITASKTKWPFGPLTVYHSGSVYYVSDGFHRTLAAIKAGRASIPCDVKKGTARDARFFGMKANDEHGLRMSRDDRRKNVVWMLENYPEMTQQNIAENAGVGLRTVHRIVGELKPPNAPMAHVGVAETLGKPSETVSDVKAAEKLAREKAKAEAAAAKAQAKLEAAGARQKIKDDAAEAKAEAKAAKEAAKQASLSPEGQVTAIKSLIQQHIGKLVRHLADLHRLKPNRAAFDASKKACEGIKTW